MIPVDYIHEALRNRARAALPASFAPENLEPTIVRAAGEEYAEDSFADQPGELVGNGLVQLRGLYYIDYYGIQNTGRDVGKKCDAVLALFPPMASIPFLSHPEITSWDTLRVRGDIIPYRYKLPFDVPGFAPYQIQIAWYCDTLRGS